MSFFSRLESLEAGAKDATEFLEWQQSMRQQDLEAELAEIERRRLEGKLSHEDAIIARQNLIKENKQKVSQMKEEVGTCIQDLRCHLFLKAEYFIHWLIPSPVKLKIFTIYLSTLMTFLCVLQSSEKLTTLAYIKYLCDLLKLFFETVWPFRLNFTMYMQKA